MKVFSEKCPSVDYQPWRPVPFWDQHAQGAEDERYFRVAQVLGRDGEPLVLDFSTQETADWVDAATRELEYDGFRRVSFPGSGTLELRQHIPLSEAWAMVSLAHTDLETVRAESVKPRTLSQT